MSFVPAPQQANAAVNAVVPTAPTAVTTAAAAEVSDFDLLFKIRTFDVFWIEKNALMYRDGIAKVGLTDV
jgi:ATP-dependent RNA helicase DDX60